MPMLGELVDVMLSRMVCPLVLQMVRCVEERLGTQYRLHRLSRAVRAPHGGMCWLCYSGRGGNRGSAWVRHGQRLVYSWMNGCDAMGGSWQKKHLENIFRLGVFGGRRG